MGISRVLIEIQKELVAQGNECDLIGPLEIGCHLNYCTSKDYIDHYSQLLKEYIQRNSKSYDVIDVDHEFLPFPRTDFSHTVLLVARTVLLVHHLDQVKFPIKKTFRSLVGLIFKSFARKKEKNFRITSANKTLMCVDLINVPNHKDKELLVNLGFDESKIDVIPYGLSNERVSLLSQINSAIPKEKKIAFIGTFDFRKGAMHFSEFFQDVLRKHPDSVLKLIGCKGMFTTKEEILAFFNPLVRNQVEIVLEFDREKIVDQLKDCRLGIFPSYMEGFPFGVLEMMMASLPVVAFDAPGAGMMVPRELLVSTGDHFAMAKVANTLLDDEKYLVEMRIKSRSIAEMYTWSYVTKLTIASYNRDNII